MRFCENTYVFFGVLNGLLEGVVLQARDAEVTERRGFAVVSVF